MYPLRSLVAFSQALGLNRSKMSLLKALLALFQGSGAKRAQNGLNVSKMSLLRPLLVLSRALRPLKALLALSRALRPKTHTK